ncbi:hypothetical protein HY251_04240 [bacterium]|nr:hypothetical protein [bacterium]
MSLCIRCGKVFDHARGCSDAPPGIADTSPPARNERALAAIVEAQAALPELQAKVGSSPREAIKALWKLQRLLERHPSADLTSFEKKRTYNEVEHSLGKVKRDLEEKLGPEVERILADLTFAKKALELSHAAILRRKEIGSINLDALAKGLAFDARGAADPTDPSASVRAAADAVKRRLDTSISVDDDVEAWGKSYTNALSTGDAPQEYPPALKGSTLGARVILLLSVVLTGSGVAVIAVAREHAVGAGVAGAGVVGFIAGAVLLATRLSESNAAPQKFQEASQRFRERLYLVCIARSLGKLSSNLSQAEEALRAHTSGESAARWKKLKTQEKDLIKTVAGDSWEEGRTVDEELSREIQAAGVVGSEAIQPPSAIGRDEWEGLAKTYLIERREDSDAANDARLAALATIVLSQGGSREDAVAARRSAILESRGVFAGAAPRATARFKSTSD